MSRKERALIVLEKEWCQREYLNLRQSSRRKETIM